MYFSSPSGGQYHPPQPTNVYCDECKNAPTDLAQVSKNKFKTLFRDGPLFVSINEEEKCVKTRCDFNIDKDASVMSIATTPGGYIFVLSLSKYERSKTSQIVSQTRSASVSRVLNVQGSRKPTEEVTFTYLYKVHIFSEEGRNSIKTIPLEFTSTI